MTISNDSWIEYIESLRKVNETAASKMLSFLNLHRDPDGLWNSPETRKAILDYAYGLSNKYGEAAAELACEMYDSVAALSGAVVPAAEPAAGATYKEVAKTVNGTLKQSSNEELISSAIARLVKRQSVDTTMQNAIRDRAEWAWIPHGDTCAFCITLASRGWQLATDQALKGGHAEHIHANCDCTYAIRFSEDTEYKGYDPDEYLEQYEDADTSSYGFGSINNDRDGKNHWQDMSTAQINGMRRAAYLKNKEKINAQKRAAYARRQEEASWNPR